MPSYKDWVHELRYEHHRQSIQNLHDALIQNEEYLAVIVGGSLTHGYYREDSDIDIMLIVDADTYAQRLASNHISYYSDDPSIITYDRGYVDGKIQGIDYLELVAERGSEPARFAFMDSKVLFTRIDCMEELIHRITRYPVEKKSENIARFHAQFEGWCWFIAEAEKRDNAYLMMQAVSSVVLFATRMFLALNERIYPYHKAMLMELEKCEDKPGDLMEKINTLLSNPCEKNSRALRDVVYGYREWEKHPESWTVQFVKDCELNWKYGNCPVADI